MLAAARAPFAPGRPIWKQRPRLERGPIRSDLTDRDLAALIQRYRFAFAVLLKSPRAFTKSTRSPSQLKIISKSALSFLFLTLSFPRIEPTVQHLLFYELDPGVNG